MEHTEALLSDPEQIVNRYANTVYRLAYSMVRAKSDADDVFQEVFLRYFRSAPDFTSAEHQKAWLLRVTLNCAKKLLSNAYLRNRARLTDDIPLATPEESGLMEALGRLSPAYRSVIHLYYYEGYRAEEIAQLLHRSAGTVRTQLVRARAQLKEQLMEKDYV